MEALSVLLTSSKVGLSWILCFFLVGGCKDSSGSTDALPKHMQTPEMVKALPELEKYSIPITGGGVRVNGSSSPGSKWCFLPDGTIFICLDKSELFPESPHGVFLLDWEKRRLRLCLRSDFLIREERLVFLNYPIPAFELDTPGAGQNLPVEFIKKDLKDFSGLGFKLRHLEVLVESPGSHRGSVWDELDRVYGGRIDPRNLDAYPEEWHDWVLRSSEPGEIGPPPPHR